MVTTIFFVWIAFLFGFLVGVLLGTNRTDRLTDQVYHLERLLNESTSYLVRFIYYATENVLPQDRDNRLVDSARRFVNSNAATFFKLRNLQNLPRR